MVSTTLILEIVFGSPAVGSRDTSTKSASLPTSIEPLLCSSKIWQAGQIVMARGAVTTSALCFSPMTLPERLRRVTVASSTRMESGSAAGASWWW